MQVTQTFYLNFLQFYEDLLIRKKKFIHLPDFFFLFCSIFFVLIISTTVLLSDFFRAQKNDRTAKDFCNLPWGRLLSVSVSLIMEFFNSVSKYIFCQKEHLFISNYCIFLEYLGQYDPSFNAQCRTFYQAFLQAQNQQPAH